MVLASTTPTWVLLTVSLIAAAASIITAVWARGTATKTTKLTSELKAQLDQDLAHLQAQLDREQRLDTARVEYMNEARKRLYEEAEPLLFQSLELAEEARSRIE